MRIAKYPARSNAALNNLMKQPSVFKVGDAGLNNFVNEVYVRAIFSPARGKLDEPDFHLEGFPIAGSRDLMKQTSIFKVGDAELNNLMKRNFYPEAFCEEARCWSAAFSSSSFTNAKSTRFAGVAMPSSLPRRAT